MLIFTPAVMKDRRLRTDSDTSVEVEERPASHPSAERHRDDRDERSPYDRVDRPDRLDKMDRSDRGDLRSRDDFYERSERDG